MPPQQPTYPLQVGSPGEQRLAILNEIYNPATQQFLLDNGLKAGMTVLEVGCGTGIMACWLAKQVGPTGKVIAIDQSAQQIAVAQENMRLQGINNIQFMTLPVEDLSIITEQVDLAFARWTLCFIPDPIAGLTAMYAALKPQGILAIADLDVGELGCFAYPTNKAMTHWMDLWKRLYLTKLGCHSLKVNFFQPALVTPREKSVAALGAKELRNAVIDSGAMTIQEIDSLINELEQLAQQPGLIGFIRTISVGARK
jgi:ubiquinone/menaquinone biosynthesis C-methylase UbiE